MEEIRLKKGGLEMVESSELTAIRGGVGWGKFAELLYKAYMIAGAISKYASSFRKGFQRGWN